MKLGAQFFTLRDFCKTPDELAESLKKVADIGYTSVQISGTCAYEPEWLAAELKKNGLTCDLTHVPLSSFTDDPAKTAADHKIFGCKYIGLGMGPNGISTDPDLDKMVEIVKGAAPAFKQAGSLFMYHNHAGEFAKCSNGNYRLWELACRTEPEELGFTLDSFWVQHGGADLIETYKLFKGRMPCVHFKDYTMANINEVRMAPVGRGNLNFEKLVAVCEDGGTEFIFVEQDNCYGEDPFKCLAESYAYLRSLGLN